MGPGVARTQGSRRTRSSTTKGADRTRRPPPVCLDGRRISSPRRYRRGARRATWTAARKAKGGSRPRSQSSCSAEGCTARSVDGGSRLQHDSLSRQFLSANFRRDLREGLELLSLKRSHHAVRANLRTPRVARDRLLGDFSRRDPPAIRVFFIPVAPGRACPLR